MVFSLLWRYFMGRGEILKPSTVFSVIGVMLGVTCSMLAMSSFSGFESTLKRAITDSQGHVMVYSRGMPMGQPEAVEKTLWESSPDVEAVVGFAMLEGLVAHQDKVGFVVLSGLPWPGFETVLNIGQNLLSGSLTPNPEAAILGKGGGHNLWPQSGRQLPFCVAQIPNPRSGGSALTGDASIAGGSHRGFG